MQISILPNLGTLPTWKLWHCAAILLLNIYFAALVQRHAAGPGRVDLNWEKIVWELGESSRGGGAQVCLTARLPDFTEEPLAAPQLSSYLRLLQPLSLSSIASQPLSNTQPFTIQSTASCDCNQTFSQHP